MSKETLIRTIQGELERLNGKIDLKIIKGLPYKKESRRHKFLNSQLKELLRQSRVVTRGNISWFQRVGSSVASFMF